MNTKFRYCPNCNTDLQGEPIPQEYIDKGYYGNETHYGRIIGIVERDIVAVWLCPDCEYRWNRFTGEPIDTALNIL